MKAWTLVKYGKPADSLELRETALPEPGPGQVRIKVEAMGLNFADVTAVNGFYRDAPPNPAVLGYDVVGTIDQLGEGVTSPAVGTRVTALTRFGGFADYALTDWRAAVPVGDMEAGKAAALATQYCTAWFAAEDRVHLRRGDHVLIQAASGGVGIALTQMAKRRGCIVYGTAGSEDKLKFIREQGVDVPINYRKEDFFEVIKKARGKEGLDVVFDSLGGKPFKQAYKLLAPSGRIVGFGAASRFKGGIGIFNDLELVSGFGFYNPAFLLMESRAIIGVNMLRVADNRPLVLKDCMEQVVDLTLKGELNPVVGGEFTADQMPQALEYLESRKHVGKIIVKW
ncbi:MAG: zinc-binding dehydrogenase [Bacteroidia bacterium]|nr:zinc-binding dehydrogenase [Bacteroidia bacterium]